MPSIPITTAPSLSIARRRLAEPLGVASFALVVFLVEVALAHGVVGPRVSRYVFLFVGVLLVALIVRFPMPTALVFLGLTDFIFFPAKFAVTMGSLDVRPHEVALTVLLALCLARPKRRAWGGWIGACLAIFLGLVVFSDLVAYASHAVSLTDAFNWVRPFYPLTFFWVVVRLFPSAEERRTLLTGGAVIAAAAGVIALFVALGTGFLQGLQSGEEAIAAEGGFGSLARVRLPGLSLGYALFWYAATQAVARRGRPRIFWSALVLGILLDIAVSYNRNMWVGLAFGLVLMTIIGGTVVRGRLMASMGAIAAAAAIFAVFGSAAGNDQIVKPILTRGATLLNPKKTTKENSLQDRAKETSIAWKTASAHPAIGVGAGVDFGVSLHNPVLSGPYVVGITSEPQLFLHNQYIYLILISGVPGLFAFVLFLGGSIATAWRRRPANPSMAALGVGLTLIMVSAIVAIYFSVVDMTAVLGFLAGVIVADAEGSGPRRLPDPGI